MRNEVIEVVGADEVEKAIAFFNVRYGYNVSLNDFKATYPLPYVGVINGVFNYFSLSIAEKSTVRIFKRTPLKVGDYVEVTGDGGHNTDHTWHKLSKHGIRKGEKHLIQAVDYRDDGFGDYTVRINDCPYRAKYLKLIENVSVTLKFRKITYKQAQEIIDIACPEWKEKLFLIWGQQIVLKQDIQVTDEWYKTMRLACTQQQHVVFDRIFGKDKKFKIGDWVTWTGINPFTSQIIREKVNQGGTCWVLNENTHTSCHEDYLRLATVEEIQKVNIPKGTPCLVRDNEKNFWRLYYANGYGRFYFNGDKYHPQTNIWSHVFRLDENKISDLPE